MGLTLDYKLKNIWHNIKAFCNDEDSFCYDLFGKRGVKVCEEWKNNYQTFSDWAMSNGYDHGLYIILLDIHGNFEPSNCKCGTYEEWSEMYDAISEEVDSNVND